MGKTKKTKEELFDEGLETKKATEEKKKQPEPTVYDMHEHAQTLLDTYDDLLDEFGKDYITDEVIDGILGTESELGNTLDALVFLKKIYAARRLICEREEKKTVQFVKRIMKRMRIEDWTAPDGKVKGKVQWRFDVDDEKIPDEYKKYNWQVVHKAVAEGKKIEGVTVHEGHLQVTIR